MVLSLGTNSKSLIISFLSPTTIRNGRQGLKSTLKNLYTHELIILLNTKHSAPRSLVLEEVSDLSLCQSGFLTEHLNSFLGRGPLLLEYS